MFRINHAIRVFWIARACIGAILCWLTATMPAAAQATAALTGTVVDESGAVMPGAAVVVTNLATMIDRRTATGSNGQFTVPLLNPGRYIVHVQRDGFTPIEVPELELNVNDNVAIRVQMKVSGLGESVSVLPEPPRSVFEPDFVMASRVAPDARPYSAL